ncbi:MAG TPA: sugar phosphate isomerase/epimerase family protein [Vicinamibacteria bacterium]|nr:sugar phosphate isomerase/epimerase family protein [Vicinamibacteria bacterium]
MSARSSLPSPSLTRRAFLAATGAGAAALSAPGPLLGATPSRVSFNTANLVARVSGYRYELSHWMDQHAKTVAATDEAAWKAICGEIAAAGFQAVDVWEAHAAPESLDEAKARKWKRILDESGLTPVSYAGGLRPETLRICQWLAIPHIDGGLRDHSPEQATALCREHGVRFNVENHPEKSAAEILAKIGGGNEWLGVCIDMGWLGTQGVSGPAVIEACGSLVRHTHVKDVKAAGKHETCLLGEGSADVAGCLAALRELKYAGWYSWEDEPEDRNPFDSAARNRQWIETRVSERR